MCELSMRLRIYVSAEEHDCIHCVDRRKLEELFIRNMHSQYADPASIHKALLQNAEKKHDLLCMRFEFSVPLELQGYITVIKLIARRKNGYNITRKVLVETARALPTAPPKGRCLRKKLLSPELLFYKPSAVIGMIQRELQPACQPDADIQEISRELLAFDWLYIPPTKYPTEVQEHSDFQRVIQFYTQHRTPTA